MNKQNLTKNLITGCIYAAALASSASYAASCQNPVPVWADEFDGSSLDTNKWDIQTGDGCSYGICGWGNSEFQSYQPDNLVVNNGMLTITAKKQRVQSKNYTSGRIRTANMPNGGQWTNGRFEARIKLPEGSGMWPAFWMLPTDPAVGWPMSGEIDIVEAVGQTNMFNFGTLHYGQAWPNNEWTQGRILKQPDRWSDDFHEYAVEWEANEMRWYIDDILYSVKTPADMSDSAYWTFEQYQYHMILNLAVGGSLGGTVDDSMLPQTMEVDYVRVYDFGQPSLSGEHIVAPNSSATYSVVDEAGNNSNYSWTAPGATGSSGNFTVNWGTQGGQVTVSGSNSCGSYQLAMDVHVLPEQVESVVWDDFEAKRNITYTYFDGAFNQSAANPGSDSVNSSAVVAQYTRNSATLYDVIAADVGEVANLSAFVTGDNAFYLDVYTAAPVGTEILIQLEDASVATPENYPNGRHSKFVAHTKVQNAWQRLRFSLEDIIDATVANASVDTLVVLIDANTNNSDTYYLDNLSIYAPDTGGPGGGDEATSMAVSSVTTGTVSAGKGKKFGSATVNVADNLGAGVAGLTVDVTFSGSWAETVQGTTDANGNVTVQTSTSLSGGVSVNACVASVTGGSLTFDAADSTGMCQ